MLITQEVITKWNGATKKYYESLGYVNTGHNTELIVNAKDLHKGSNINVDFKCDECGMVAQTRYVRYFKNNCKYQRDMCRRCICGIISQDTRTNNSHDTHGNYDTHVKRAKSLKEYLDINNTLEHMIKNKVGKRLYDNFKKHDDCVYNTAIELGYRLEDISSSLPKNYYIKNPEKVKDKLLDFIKDNDRFPSFKELDAKLKINSYLIKKLGGLDEIKKIANYNDSKDLIDVRGDYNKSMGEFIVANYFCSQGLSDKYKREQYPFPLEDNRFRSDFTFYVDNKEIHVEIWGIKKCNTSTKMQKEYHQVRKIKEDLYKKYSDTITLVSIDYEIFDMPYDNIQKYLYDIFSEYFALPLQTIPYDKLILASQLTSEEIFIEVMRLSEDGLTFPNTAKLIDYNSGLYTQILKRGYSYSEFFNKYNQQQAI